MFTGNNRLGGQDFNEVLYNYLLERAQTDFNVDQGHLTDFDHQVILLIIYSIYGIINYNNLP